MSEANDPWESALCAPRDGLPSTAAHVAKWFPVHYYHGSELSLESQAAIEICRNCPIQDPCYDYAMEHRLDDGIWGGSTPQDRGRRRRKRFAA